MQEEQLFKLEQEIQQMVDIDGIKHGVSDGIINPAIYKKAKYKVLWILYEPYGDTGGWSLSQAMDQYACWTEITDSFKFHRQLIYTVYGILNNFILREDMPEIHEPDVFFTLKSFAYINVKKIPNSVARKNPKEIKQHALKNMPLLLRQIDDCNPDIVIMGGTMNYFRQVLPLNREPDGTCGTVNYYRTPGRLYLEAYHPSNTTLKDTVYCNEIIEAVKQNCL